MHLVAVLLREPKLENQDFEALIKFVSCKARCKVRKKSTRQSIQRKSQSVGKIFYQKINKVN